MDAKCPQISVIKSTRCTAAPQKEREREFICHNKKTYKIIIDITIVAGYQIGKPIKLVAYSTNYINS